MRIRGAATVGIVVSACGRALAQLQYHVIVAVVVAVAVVVVVVVCKTFALAQLMCVGGIVGSIRIVAQLVQ